MKLPFTTEAFLRVFQDHNAAIGPAQIIALAIGFVNLAALFVRCDESRRVTMAALGVLWAFTGVGYQLLAATALQDRTARDSTP